MSGYRLGQRSRRELHGVHPDLVKVIERAICLTTQDFSVHDGIRTEEQQRQLVARGASKTMNSMHLPQVDGYGHAVDLVPWDGRKLRWEWPLIYPIAVAMRTAAMEVGLPLRWGGVWDRPFLSLEPGTVYGMKVAVEQYAARHPGPAFLDGPHYEVLD